MNTLKQTLLAFFAVAVSGLAHAEAPFIEYQWAKSPDACFERANDSMQKAGFKITAKNNMEVVGIRGNYKGVIACIDESSDMAVFIVAGPVYAQAKQYSEILKEKFLN